jgi:glucose/arabinose dehydrogenase
MKASMLAVAIAGLAACAPTPSSAQGETAAGPVETRPPNGVGQTPAFPGQTRAPMKTANVAYSVKTLAGPLNHPWGLAFLPDGALLVSERPGRLRIITQAGVISPPLGGVPAVLAQEQGGLLDLALSPAFTTDHRVFMTYLEARPGGAGIAVAHAVLAPEATALSDVKVIFRATPAVDDFKNDGGRLAFAPDGTLYVTIGDRFSHMAMAQSLDNDVGKVVHITPEGSPAPGNPFLGKPAARPEIWSYGHRNPIAAAVQPSTGRLWTIENGAKGGDEVNIPAAGKNYGWPVITYGIDYSGKPIGAGITAHAGMEQPIYYWDPVIAPSGMAFYDADLFPAWKGSLLVGSLKEKHVARLTLDGDRVVGEERLFTGIGKRVRNVKVGPDGAIYLLTDEDEGHVLKVTPKE